jgi:beta-lactamase class D
MKRCPFRVVSVEKHLHALPVLVGTLDPLVRIVGFVRWGHGVYFFAQALE